MKVINHVLKNRVIWNLSQIIFGEINEKMQLYRSVIKKPGRILDFGCANGITFPAFRDFEYYGCDINPMLIQEAREKYHHYKNAHFIAQNIARKKFPMTKFDYILFAGTGHHLDDTTLIHIFHRLARLLKKDGQLHYFDPIRLPQSDSLSTKLLIYLDQGKFIRHLFEYSYIKTKLPQTLRVTQEKIHQFSRVLIPPPKFMYWKIEKVK